MEKKFHETLDRENNDLISTICFHYDTILLERERETSNTPFPVFSEVGVIRSLA